MNRRDFLRAAAQAGLAIGWMRFVPGPLGCAGGGRGQRIHLDLSGFLEGVEAGGSFHLHAPFATHALVPHDDGSRAAIAAGHPLRLAGLADDVTHFVDGVEIPLDRLSMSHVSYRAPSLGAGYELVGFAIHPFSGMDVSGGGWSPVASSSAQGDAGEPGPACGEPHPTGTAMDTAASLVFSHPEITSLDPAEAEGLACLVYNTASVVELARCLKSQGRATATGGFATLVPIVDASGNPVLSSSGSALQNIRLSDLTMAALRPAVHDVLRKVKRSASFPSKRFASGEGLGAVARSEALLGDAPAAAAAYRLEPKIPEGSRTHGVQWVKVRLDGGAERSVRIQLRNHHLRWFGVYVEYLDAEGKALPLAGLSLPNGLGWLETTSEWCGYNTRLDTPTARFIGFLPAPPVFFGVPVTGVGDVSWLDFVASARMPEQAVTMRVVLGSLGSGSWRETKPIVPGAVMTLLLQYGLPLYTIYGAYGMDETASLWKDYLKWTMLADLTSETIAAFPIVKAWCQDDATSDDQDQKARTASTRLLVDLADNVARFLLDTRLARWILGKQAKLSAEEKIPFIGLAFQVATVGFAIDDMLATTVEVANNPALFDNRITVPLDLALTIRHDLDRFQFPATATHYQVTATLAGGHVYTVGPVALPATTVSDPIQVRVPSVPSGGTVRVFVQFTNAEGQPVGEGHAATHALTATAIAQLRKLRAADGDVAAVATALSHHVGASYANTHELVTALEGSLGADTSDRYAKDVASLTEVVDLENVLASGAAALAVDCTIVEFPPPLGPATRYEHKQKLALGADGSREWRAGPAPTRTASALACTSGPAELCAVGDAGLVERTGVFAYAWRAASAGLPQCQSGTTETQLWSLQSVSLTQHPQDALRRATWNADACGKSASIGVVVDPMGPHSGRGLNFAIVPGLDPLGGPAWHLRRLTLDGAAPLELGRTTSCGRLGAPPSSTAVHPGGYVASVSRGHHKLEVLQLSIEPVPDEDAPAGVLYSGEGDLPGMLDGPMVVRTTADGLFFVLEQGNRRVQAFDRFGRPVSRFADGTSPFFPIAGGGQGTLLDMGVEAKGFVYVLGYEGSGAAPADFFLDVYRPDGTHLARSTGIAAARMVVDRSRNVYAINHELLIPPDLRAEPSISLWIPHTPAA